MFVKIAPDLDEAQVAVIAATLQRHGIDGVIATNTTLARDARGRACRMPTRPAACRAHRCWQPSNRVIRQLRAALGKGFPIIGVGGVMSGTMRAAKIDAGADLVQIYTGLIYHGPALVPEVARALASAR